MENSQISKVKSNKVLKLAPETIRIRDAIVEKYLDVPLDTLSSKLQSLISNETDTGTRLGILSARVEILRMRFANITGRTYIKDQGEESGESDAAEQDIDTDESEEGKEGWMTLKILEASEVNGVRFPEGVKIDVHTEDAKKLLASKKAELLSMKVEPVIEIENQDIEDDLEHEDIPEDSKEITKDDSDTSGNEKVNNKIESKSVEVEEQGDTEENALNSVDPVETSESNTITEAGQDDDSNLNTKKESSAEINDTISSDDTEKPEAGALDSDGGLGLSPEELADLTGPEDVSEKPKDKEKSDQK